MRRPNSQRSPRTPDAAQALLARLAPLQSAYQAGGQHAGKASPLDFGTLPGFEKLRMERAVGTAIGYGTPYFRMHDDRPQAHTRIAGRDVLDFSSYDYLGLNADARVAAAAHAAIERYGVSAVGSRHVAGERPVHRDLERALAAHYRSDDCAVLVSGYATNLGVIGQLVGPKDLLVCDAVVHDSAVAGGAFSGAARRSFAHNDLDDLERVLAQDRGRYERALIVVEGLYGMDGDVPDLERLIAIKQRYTAWLMVDEAHALGTIGARGAGSFEQCGVDPRDIDIWMGTLSKTLAGCGGFIAGSATLIDYIKSLVGVFVFSVAMPPVIAAAAQAALAILHGEPQHTARLQANAVAFREGAARRGLRMPDALPQAAVCPILVGDSISAVILSHRLLARDVNVLPVLYPAVPANAARLRFFVSALHGAADIDNALDILADEIVGLPAIRRALKLPGA